ncbi:MAG: nucleoside 2-deoxyribosyltransferase [Syntrophorhabdaceae bacterium]|nr:nucleoside 2-deoxyribosyltransferase [Syntrophorhabdaceae bacterium]MDD5244643.1 nucleoside 2-deoxyribosyltransferase [Syntrophorhabdaceae bacterium]
MKVYFAHPCFDDTQKGFKTEFLNKLSSALTHRNDILIVDPFDHTPNIEGDIETKLKMAENVKIGCIRLLEECDIVVALVDGNDTGVAFEAGYAHAVNKPVILISQQSCSAANAMLIGAARIMVDNVLEREQIEKLAGMLEWFDATISKYPGKPRNN